MNPHYYQNEIDRLLFKMVENDLSEQEMSRLEELLAERPELNHEAELWEDTIVQDEHMEYPEVEQLYRKRNYRTPVAFGVAGGLAAGLFAVTYLWMTPADQLTSHKKATVQSTINQKNSASNLEYASYAGSSFGSEAPRSSVVVSSTSSDAGGADAAPHHNENAGTYGTTPSSTGVRTGSTNGVGGQQSSFHANAVRQSLAISNSGSEVRNPDHNVNATSSGASSSVSGHDAKNSTLVTSKAWSVDLVLNKVEKEGYALDRSTNAGWKPTSVKKDGVVALSTSSSKKGMDPDDERRKSRGSKFRRLGLTNLREHLYAIPNYSSLVTSPANVGALRVPKISMQQDYRWPSSSQSQLTSRLGMEGYLRGLNAGLGAQLEYTDLAGGAYRDYRAEIFFSPKIKVGRYMTLEPGIGMTMGHATMNPEKAAAMQGVEFGSLAPSAAPTTSEESFGVSEWYQDMHLGLNLNTRFMYAGLSARNVLAHKQYLFSEELNTVSRTPLELTAVVGTDYERKGLSTFSLSPYMMYRYTRERHEAWAGLNFGWKWLTGGVAANHHGEFGTMVGFRASRFQMDYTFGYTQSQFEATRNMQHSLRLNILLSTPKF